MLRAVIAELKKQRQQIDIVISTLEALEAHHDVQHVMSASARRRIAAAQRLRWQRWKRLQRRQQRQWSSE